MKMFPNCVSRFLWFLNHNEFIRFNRTLFILRVYHPSTTGRVWCCEVVPGTAGLWHNCIPLAYTISQLAADWSWRWHWAMSTFMSRTCICANKSILRASSVRLPLLFFHHGVDKQSRNGFFGGDYGFRIPNFGYRSIDVPCLSGRC